MPPSSEARTDYSILAEFGASIDRPRLSVFYLGAMVVVAGTLLVLPLIYLALICGIAWLVYYHAVYHWHAIMDMSGYTSGQLLIFKFLLYFTPLLAGAVVVFFLFKPLLARRPRRATPLALNPADNPLLYAFIARICDIVGAPPPSRIDLDCQINASASFRRGFLRNDMVLTLGLPLVANLSAREMAGVIAHEFGHFTQGTAMRLSYVSRSVIGWFARVAYQRDAWDEALEQWSEEASEADVRVAVVVWCVQIAVWFSRLILKTLMFIGIAVGGFMLRQMEYDADAYEIRVAGSEAFESTTRKLATLEAASAESDKQLVAMWRKNRTLPDNLPEMLRDCHEHLRPAVLERINDTLGLRRTGVFDSHPSPADRIREARKAADPGIFHDDRPASELFASFEHPARFVTLLHYTDDLGIPITDKMLTHIDVKAGSSAPAQSPVSVEPGTEFRAWTFGLMPFLLPLTLQDPKPSADLDEDSAELARLTAGLQQLAGQLSELGQKALAFSDQASAARAGQTLLSKAVAIQEEAPIPSHWTPEQAGESEAQAREEEAAIRHSLHEVLSAMGRRVALGVSIALASGEAQELESRRQECADLAQWFNEHAEEYSRRITLAEAGAVYEKIGAVKVAGKDQAGLEQALEEARARLRSISDGLGPQSASDQPKARLRVELNKGGGLKLAASADAIREKNRAWLAAYGVKLDELARIVSAVEPV